MTTVLTVFCSRCAARIDQDRTELFIESGPLRSRLAEESIDLGPCCLDAFVTWLGAPALSHAPAGPAAPPREPSAA